MTFFKSPEPMLHFYHQDCIVAKQHNLAGGSWTISNPPENIDWYCPWCGEFIHANLSPDSDVAEDSDND